MGILRGRYSGPRGFSLEKSEVQPPAASTKAQGWEGHAKSILTGTVPRKLTWQWIIHHLKMHFLLKMEIFQCHVSFQGCNWEKTRLWIKSTRKSGQKSKVQSEVWLLIQWLCPFSWWVKYGELAIERNFYYSRTKRKTDGPGLLINLYGCFQE